MPANMTFIKALPSPFELQEMSRFHQTFAGLNLTGTKKFKIFFLEKIHVCS